MSNLFFIPKSDFDQVRALGCDPALRAQLFADMCRINVLYMIQRAGSGHIGSSFSSLDIVSWLYLNVLNEGDVYFSSKGHDCPGLYAVMAAMGILDFEMIHSLRRLGGLPGHPDVSLNGIPANTGSLGMGVSKAKGMFISDELAGKTARRIYVMLGDGELQEGQLWESLSSAFYRGMDRITAVVDHNKIQSDTWVELTSPLGDIEAKFAAFGWHVDRIDGHSFEALRSAFSSVLEVAGRPQVIIADTVKGSGVSQFRHSVDVEDDTPYPYHSGALSISDYERVFDELSGRVRALAKQVGMVGPSFEKGEVDPIQSAGVEPQKLVAAYADALERAGSENQEIVVLDADLKYDCGLGPFSASHPERFFECGIAEQDMVSMAGAMSLKGVLPIVHSFGCFLTPRANEQIYNNATEKSRVGYIGFLAGLLPAGPGHSHQALRDISVMSSVPNMTCFAPSCEAEVALAVDHFVTSDNGNFYIRFTSIPYPVSYALPAGYSLLQGRGGVVREGSDGAIIAYGPVMLEQAFQAAQDLESKGLSIRVVNMPWLNTVSSKWLKDTVADLDAVLTVDDHYLSGGQGEMIGLALAEIGLIPSKGFHRLGVQDVPACGRNDEVLKQHGLDSGAIAARLAAVLMGSAK